MNVQWIAHPVLQYALEAAGLVLCVYLFFTLKRDARQAEIADNRRARVLDVSIGELRAKIIEMSTRLREAEERAGVLVAPVPPRSGLNLTKRSQALRLHRRGETPQKIAATLALPQREVELMLKVHRIVMSD